MLIIGISGTNGSGKDTIANWLGEKHGFYVASATLIFEEELAKRGLPFERENKRALSAEWRKQYGRGVLVDKAIAKAQEAGYDKLVVGSLRNDGEVDRVHELNGIVVWFDADKKVRYDRIVNSKRGRVEDQKTFEQFVAEEEIEMHPTGDNTTLNMFDVRRKSDRTIMNDVNDVESFIQLAQTTLADLL
jgi:cytidylate kinase